MNIRKALPSDSRGIAKVAVDTWRSAYRGILPDHVLDGLTYEQREENWNRIFIIGIDIVFVAENVAGEVIGYASGGKERRSTAMDQGELYTLYLLEQYQRLGLGKQLLLSVARELDWLGMRSMLVWVLAENPSRFFYESLGAQKVEAREIEIGGGTLPEIGYSWASMREALLS
ncbi:GNAT family N-acetyltransferase [Paenibacillus koleovorans]|uniref:GNAT family N-acetyltransferase n=1 Tax=Paenibacillus koleovorans TaxID=121608 RepID=UPI000FD9B8E1|nr:GNAT family N-acetyltransferase [Paenibacillus koleovorans]